MKQFLTVLLAFFAPLCGYPASTGKPNILWISIEDHVAGYVKRMVSYMPAWIESGKREAKYE